MTKMLTRSDFAYQLPSALIAQAPAAERAASRLMVLDPQSRTIAHTRFVDICQWLTPADLIVVNDTRVIRARLFARKDSGGRAEILVERVVASHEAWCLVRVSKPLKPGRTVTLESGETLVVVAREDDRYRLRFAAPVFEVLERVGHVPLPPYIARADQCEDGTRYQTVYANQPGAVAAPTAGLHFDLDLLKRIRAKGVAVESITLHVGAGTFQPVRVDDLTAHRMHSEWLQVRTCVVEAVNACRARGGRVIAVGTTVVRALESAALGGELGSFEGETDIFIYPGFRFRAVDALITNFHLPESSLLMLVSAFAGRRFVLDAYSRAIEQSYRFFSYGDAMLITSRVEAADAL